MGVEVNIDYERFPKQGDHLNCRTRVCFNYKSRDVWGTIVRDDLEAPHQTVIRLDDGRYILSTECQYAPTTRTHSPAQSDERLRVIRERLKRATRGPWKVYKTRYTLTELGRKQGFKEDRVSVVNAIGTEWDHPQLKGPDAIVTTTHGPYYDPQHAVQIGNDDAEFIAHAREDIPYLLSLLDSQQSPAQAEWLPMSEAPKTTMSILLWWPYWCRSHPIVGYYYEGRWRAPEVLSDEGDGPLGWQHLPAPPKETSK